MTRVVQPENFINSAAGGRVRVVGSEAWRTNSSLSCVWPFKVFILFCVLRYPQQRLIYLTHGKLLQIGDSFSCMRCDVGWLMVEKFCSYQLYFPVLMLTICSHNLMTDSPHNFSRYHEVNCMLNHTNGNTFPWLMFSLLSLYVITT